MSSRLQLTQQEREFLALVDRVANCNPFSSERDDLNRLLAETEGSRDELLDAMCERVSQYLSRIDQRQRTTPSRYGKGDQKLLRSAFIFEAYHLHFRAFDALIEQQLAHPAAPCRVPFARDALGHMARRGFTADQAERLFAIFYQWRRAFYFIEDALIGTSPSVRQLRLQLWSNVFTSDLHWYEEHLWDRMEDFSTLLLGETGTGKGTAAAAIGRSCYIPFDPDREQFAETFTASLIALNLSQFPESLIESELFGHRKGAFTGAVEHHEGIFARCRRHGSIFLDEIGDVSVPVQIKLLQVLQERTFSPVGSHEQQRFAGRVVAATNRSLDTLRHRGQFRDDFYYRLCSDVITVPSLRQRLREDPTELPTLLGHILRRMTGGQAGELESIVLATLQEELGPDYAWPGNVRELEQATRRILLTRHYPGDRRPVASDPIRRLLHGVETGTLTAERLLAGYCGFLYRQHGQYEEVARRVGLDRRTVKKYVLASQTDDQEHAP